MGESNVLASAEAAFLVIESIKPKILSVFRKPNLVRKLVDPLTCFYWSRAMLTKMGSKPINDITK